MAKTKPFGDGLGVQVTGSMLQKGTDEKENSCPDPCAIKESEVS